MPDGQLRLGAHREVIRHAVVDFVPLTQEIDNLARDLRCVAHRMSRQRNGVELAQVQ